MKRIDPNEPVLTNNITALTNEEAKMLTKYWHNGERLWKGKMPRHSFQLAPSESIRAFVFNYFQYECYKKSADEIADDDVNITDFWLEILPKILWLSEAWLDNGLFDEPWILVRQDQQCWKCLAKEHLICTVYILTQEATMILLLCIHSNRLK